MNEPKKWKVELTRTTTEHWEVYASTELEAKEKAVKQEGRLKCTDYQLSNHKATEVTP